MLLGIWTKVGLKLREMMLASFRKQNTFNNSRADLKFCTDLVDSMNNMPWALDLVGFSVIHWPMKTFTFPAKNKYFKIIYAQGY